MRFAPGIFPVPHDDGVHGRPEDGGQGHKVVEGGQGGPALPLVDGLRGSKAEDILEVLDGQAGPLPELHNPDSRGG